MNLEDLDGWRDAIDYAGDDVDRWRALWRWARWFVQDDGFHEHIWRYVDLMNAAPCKRFLEASANECWFAGWNDYPVLRETYERRLKDFDDGASDDAEKVGVAE